MGRWERLAPLTGVIAVVLFLAEAVITGDTPAADTPARDVVAFWRDNAGVQETGAALFGLSAVAFVWFGGSLAAAIRATSTGAARLATVALAGTVMIAVGLAVYVTFGVAIVHSVDDESASTTQTLNVLNGEAAYGFLAIGTVLLVSATGLAVLRYGGLPRWLGWISAAHGVVAFVVLVAGAFVPGLGFLAFLLLVYWVPLVATLVYRGDAGSSAVRLHSSPA